MSKTRQWFKSTESYPGFRLSLRYKVALPVLIFVTLMLFLLFRTTFLFVREMVLERHESRLMAISEVFTESLKVPMILGNQEVLIANLEWMARRSDVLEVRVEDEDGVSLGSTDPDAKAFEIDYADEQGTGVHRISQDRYVVSVPIQVSGKLLGRLIIVYSQLGFEEELNRIFAERMAVALVMGIALALMTAGVTWLAVRPLFTLKRTVQQILAGDLSARAHVDTFDEIEDLAEAFNEMVARLGRSLDNLRARTEALEESEEKYRLIVDNASDIIFALTPEGEIVFLNEGFSGCAREQILHEGLHLILELNTEETRVKLEEALMMVQEKKTSVTNVALTHIHRRNQSEIYYLTNLTPLVDHVGKVKLIQGVMRDVTELRRIEIMKESLIRDVAHELKTPTAKFEMAVNWFEKEIDKDDSAHKYAPLVEMLKNNTERLMRTITSIMDLSRLESGMQQIEKVEINLNDVITQVCDDMSPLCEKKGLKLEKSLTEDPLTMQGDRDMLYRLFVNLISNSIKFTKEGGIRLKTHREGGMIYVEVIDTGIGIADDDLKTIFDRFVQKTASSLGIGVGLTICRDIAALHEGRVWAESAGLGKGAAFMVEFHVG